MNEDNRNIIRLEELEEGKKKYLSENELKNIKNLGKKSLDEINECLVEHGFGPDFELPENTRVNLIKKLEQLKVK